MGFIAPALGALGEAAGTAGSAIGSAAGTVGSALGGAAGGIGSALESAVPGLSGLVQGAGNIAQGIGGLGAPSEADYLASLGQTVPQGVDIAGPSPTFTGPGFAGGFAQGFMGAPKAYASATPGTSFGQGLGQLFASLDQMRGGGGVQGVPQPELGLRNIVSLANRVLQGPEAAPAGAPPSVQQGPIMKMIGQLFAGF